MLKMRHWPGVFFEKVTKLPEVRRQLPQKSPGKAKTYPRLSIGILTLGLESGEDLIQIGEHLGTAALDTLLGL